MMMGYRIFSSNKLSANASDDGLCPRCRGATCLPMNRRFFLTCIAATLALGSQLALGAAAAFAAPLAEALRREAGSGRLSTSSPPRPDVDPCGVPSNLPTMHVTDLAINQALGMTLAPAGSGRVLDMLATPLLLNHVGTIHATERKANDSPARELRL